MEIAIYLEEKMTDSVKLKARAKINLSIDIKGIFDDGYHDVEKMRRVCL